MKLDQTIEVILFAAAKPFSLKRLAELTESESKEVEAALKTLAERLKDAGSGIMLQKNGH